MTSQVPVLLPCLHSIFDINDMHHRMSYGLGSQLKSYVLNLRSQFFFLTEPQSALLFSKGCGRDIQRSAWLLPVSIDVFP